MISLKQTTKVTATLVCFLAVQAEASVFLEFMYYWLELTDMASFKALLVWQLGGLFVPLMAGPTRIAANAIWNYSQEDNGVTIDSQVLRAYLYVGYDIKTSDDLNAYLIDFVVYGKIYDVLGLSTTFTEIDFFPSDLFCY